MAVYRFQAIIEEREDYEEAGTIVADTEDDARRKLREHDYNNVKLKRLSGISGIFKKFTADIK